MDLGHTCNLYFYSTGNEIDWFDNNVHPSVCLSFGTFGNSIASYFGVNIA